MDSYEIDFQGPDVIITRKLSDAGDTFVVDNRFKDHVGSVVEGEVIVTREDNTTFTLRAGESVPVTVGDKWRCVATIPGTVTTCSLPANDAATWQEIGLSRAKLEQYADSGNPIITRKTRAEVRNGTQR